MALTNLKIKDTYKDLLTVLDTDNANQGIESGLKTVSDGEGVATAIQLSTSTLKIPSGKTLDIAGTLSVSDASLVGNLTVGDDLTVTDLISGNSMEIVGNIKAGGGYVAGSGSGVTLTSTGAVSMNSTLTVESNAIIDSLTVGGGYGEDGVTVSSGGNLQVAGLLTVDGNIKTGGHIKALSVQPEGADKPKLDLEENDNIRLKLTVSSVEKNIMKVTGDGEMKVTNTSGVQKFLVRDDGRVKLTGMTTSTRTNITGEAGDMVYDTDLDAFMIWKP